MILSFILKLHLYINYHLFDCINRGNITIFICNATLYMYSYIIYEIKIKEIQ